MYKYFGEPLCAFLCGFRTLCREKVKKVKEIVLKISFDVILSNICLLT